MSAHFLLALCEHTSAYDLFRCEFHEDSGLMCSQLIHAILNL